MRICVDGEYVAALSQEVDEIAAGTAPCVEDAHRRRDVSAQKLIEEVDVDLTELFLRHHVKKLPARSDALAKTRSSREAAMNGEQTAPQRKCASEAKSGASKFTCRASRA